MPSHSSSVFFKIDTVKTLNRIFNSNLRQRVKQLNLKTPISIQKNVIHKFLPLGRASEGNKIHYYNNGTSLIEAQQKAIDNAQKSINMEMYTIEPDRIGRATLDKLTKASKRGVKVNLLVDDFGSNTLSFDNLTELGSAGANITQYNRIQMFKIARVVARCDFRMLKAMIFRNHRKSLTIDDQLAFVGSANFGENYANQSIGGNGRFRDSGCSIMGPAVFDISDVFKQSLSEGKREYLAPHKDIYNSDNQPLITPPRFLSSKRPLYKFLMRRQLSVSGQRKQKTFQRNRLQRKSIVSNNTNEDLTSSISVQEQGKFPAETFQDTFSNCIHGQKSTITTLTNAAPNKVSKPQKNIIKPCSSDTSGTFLQILSSARRRGKRHISVAVEMAINNAQNTCYITNPYFAPSKPIRHALANAAKRGVDVRILTVGESDVTLYKQASQIHLKFLLEHGVRVYELQNRVLHAKTMIVDGLYTSIGTFNFDDQSEYRNLETNVTSICPQCASILSKHFYDDLRESKELRMLDIERRSLFENCLHKASFWVTKFPNFIEFSRPKWNDRIIVD